MTGHHLQIGETRALVQRDPGLLYSSEDPGAQPWLLGIYWWACGTHKRWGAADTPAEREEQIARHTAE